MNVFDPQRSGKQLTFRSNNGVHIDWRIEQMKKMKQRLKCTAN